MISPTAGQLQKSKIRKRTVYVDGRKKSVSLEPAFWNGLREIARAQNMRATEIVSKLDREPENPNLSSSIRLFVLEHYRTLAATKR